MGNCFGTTMYSNPLNPQQSLLVKVTNLSKTSKITSLITKCMPISKPIIKIDESGSLMMRKNNIVFGSSETCSRETIDPETEELMRFNWEDQSLEIIANQGDNRSSDLSDKCWYLIDDRPKEKGHVLNAGDVVSFGSVKLRVRSLEGCMHGNLENSIHNSKFNAKKNSPNSSPESKTNSENLTTAEDSLPSLKSLRDSVPEIEDTVCRICLEGSSNEEDPIVHLCKCSGSIKNAHIQCLKRWHADRIIAKSSRFLLCYYWEPFKCELCKSTLANEVHVNGKTYSLIDLPAIKQPHITFECFMNDSSNGVHIVKFDDQKAARTIGRGSKSDVVINDPSVAGEQAIITYQDGLFRLSSRSSNKSTCVLIQNKKIPLHMLNGVKIKRRDLVFKIKTSELKMEH